MRFLSLFSGLEGASLAWEPLGWTCAAVSEIDPAACAVLAHRYPNIPNLGDVTKVTEAQIQALGHIDIVVFGSPCQDVSIAGKRAGMKGARSGLFFTAMRIIRWSRARYALWENVPGVFSDNEGRGFAAVVGEMVGIHVDVPDGGWRDSGFFLGPDALTEWRTLDAQFFGLAQRRRRVFALRDSGDWQSRPPILLERESLCGNPAPSREARQVAPTIPARSLGGGGLGTDFDCDGGVIASTGAISHCLNAGGMGRQDYETETLILRANGFDAGEDGTGRGTPLVPVIAFEPHHDEHEGRGANFKATDTHPALRGPHGCDNPLVAQLCSIMPQNSGKDYKARPVEVAQPVMTAPTGGNQGGDYLLTPVVFDTTQITSSANYSNPKPGDPCHPLAAGAHPPAIAFRASGQDGFTPSPIAPPITSTDGGGAGVPTIAFSCKDHGADAGELSPTLRGMGHDGSHANAGGQVAICIQERAICENPDAGPDGVGIRTDGIAYTVEARPVPQVSHALRADGFDASEDGTGRGTPLVPVTYSIAPASADKEENIFVNRTETARTLGADTPDPGCNQGGLAILAPAPRSMGHDGSHFQDSEFGCKEYDTAAIRAGGIPEHSMILNPQMAVRRLTPRECERLQGVPDEYTLVSRNGKPMADGPRYKMLGNGFAVPVIAWIGKRIQEVESTRKREGCFDDQN